MTKFKTIFITGANGGIGLELANQSLEKNFYVLEHIEINRTQNAFANQI